ncbi:hypothetical protein LI90_3994 [Carbonactinospora thermoautotrophica]|uniref:Uncharacterized protein n=1 Tax=Carbonactinospora thermoautotrophica TaxID=1469144 RepID=A0A132MYF7_9ACTN|nr:hypothetical protein [Carbonactinospora thermoautotrophica]KWX02945.1 hypothetical protein LI90_3994 [Carbonactinospora thermoautotrophica]
MNRTHDARALVRLDPGEMRELVVEAWRRTAPRQLVAAYDAEH